MKTNSIIRGALLAAALIFSTAVPASATLVDPTATPKSDGGTTIVQPQHVVECSLNIGQAYRPYNTNAVSVSGGWRCNASPDVAMTSITVQIYENGAWRNYGNATSTASTQPNYNFSDGAGLKPGCWSYRGYIYHEAYHGTWDQHSKVSSQASTICY